MDLFSRNSRRGFFWDTRIHGYVKSTNLLVNVMKMEGGKRLKFYEKKCGLEILNQNQNFLIQCLCKLYGSRTAQMHFF